MTRISTPSARTAFSLNAWQSTTATKSLAQHSRLCSSVRSAWSACWWTEPACNRSTSWLWNGTRRKMKNRRLISFLTNFYVFLELYKNSTSPRRIYQASVLSTCSLAFLAWNSWARDKSTDSVTPWCVPGWRQAQRDHSQPSIWILRTTFLTKCWTNLLRVTGVNCNHAS